MQLDIDSSDRENFRVRGPDGALLYVVRTPRTHGFFSSNPTFLSRPLQTPQGQGHGDGETEVIAKLDFPLMGDNMIEFNGRNAPLEAFFPKKNWPSRSRLMATPTGAWKWSMSERHPILYNTNRVLVVAYIHKTSIFNHRPPKLNVALEAVEFLDMIMVGLLVALRDIERNRRRSASHFSAGAAGASAAPSSAT